MSGQERLPLMVRLFVIVKLEGVPHSPFTPLSFYRTKLAHHEKFPKIPYENDYFSDNVYDDVEDVLGAYMEDTAELLAGLGIRLDLHPDGVVYIFNQDWFDVNEHNIGDIISYGWEQGQPWINIYFASTIQLADEIGAGVTILRGAGRFDGRGSYENCGIVIAGPSAVGPNIAHEIGHVLGLPHTFAKDPTFFEDGSVNDPGAESWETDDLKFSALAMQPFEDDTQFLDTEAELLTNPMSYVWKTKDSQIEYARNMEVFRWTPSQVRRAQLTLLSRRSYFAYYANENVSNPDYPPMPDFSPAFAAAWMG